MCQATRTMQSERRWKHANRCYAFIRAGGVRSARTRSAINGREKLLGFQFAGESSKGLPPGGEWRCMFIDQIEEVEARDGQWHTRDDHLQPQTCVDEIDYEVFA